MRATTLVIRIGVYVLLYMLTVFFLGPVFGWLGGLLVGIALTGLAASTFTNALSMRIFEGLPLVDIGLHWNGAAARNLGLGLAGGIVSASVVLATPLVARMAHFAAVPNPEAGAATAAFAACILLVGSAGEEMLFRGYGFQILLRSAGAWAAILPVGILFAALHAFNPNATWLGIANTAGFGILFGYAFLRTYDLWLPIGLHFGWNFTLPLFGVNVSGLKIGVTGYTMQWSAGGLWSGGEYGPEASILTTGVLALLFAWLRKAPVRKQASALVDLGGGDRPCVAGQQESE